MAPTLAVLALEAMLFAGWFDFKSITLESVKLRRREETLAGGGELIWLEFVIDFNAKIALDIPATSSPGMPKIQTDPEHPITVVGARTELRLGVEPRRLHRRGAQRPARLRPVVRSRQCGVVRGRRRDDHQGVAVHPSPRSAIGEWERGMWFDLGLQVFRQGERRRLLGGAEHHALLFPRPTARSITSPFSGATFSLLVPMTIYARGEWTMSRHRPT